MQFPESWLREFCDPQLNTQQLADTLTMAGLEVEELEPVAPPFTKIVVGEIKEAVQHPNADRLRVCQVDVGQGSLLNIVCGAPNARVGIKVPCALVGAELPPGEDGKPKQFKKSSVDGFKDFLTNFEGRNVTDDADLSRLVDQARRILDGATIESLRRDEPIRERLLASFEEVKASVAPMVVANRREIHFEDEV